MSAYPPLDPASQAFLVRQHICPCDTDPSEIVTLPTSIFGASCVRSKTDSNVPFDEGVTATPGRHSVRSKNYRPISAVRFVAVHFLASCYVEIIIWLLLGLLLVKLRLTLIVVHVGFFRVFSNLWLHLFVKRALQCYLESRAGTSRNVEEIVVMF